MEPEPTGEIIPLRKGTFIITHEIVLQAKHYVESGATTGMVVEWRDANERGLVLRLTSTAATWYIRHRKATLRIGTIADTGVFAAREMTRKAIRMLEENLDARQFLNKVLKVRKNDGEEIAYYYEQGLWLDDDGTIRDSDDPEIWTWAHLRDKYLEEKLPKLAPRWASQYNELLKNKAFSYIEQKPVKLISYKDLDIIKKTLKKNLAISQASRAISAARAMLDWAYEENASATGLDELQFIYWARWRISRVAGTREHVPELSELARTIVLAEHLESVSGGARTSGSVDGSLVGALWALVLTGQRIGQLLQTPTKRYFNSPDAPEGWTVVSWKPCEMKKVRGSPLPHSLPLPPEAIAIIEHHRSARSAEVPGWLFPSSRGSGHVSAGGVGSLLRRLQGIRHKGAVRLPGQPDGRRVRGRIRTGSSKRLEANLLEEHGIAPWVPHDVRRTLATFLQDRGLGGAASAILAHREHKEEDKREHAKERALPVTRIHYSRSQQIALKSKGMALWTQAVFNAYNEEKTKFYDHPHGGKESEAPRKSWRRPECSEKQSVLRASVYKL